MSRVPQVVAFGGGGFSMESGNALLDDYVLAATGVERPKVCFLPTASADSQDYIDRFYAAFSPLSCEPSHQPLFDSPPRDIPQFLLSQDVIYVGGGNTHNMLALWRAWGLDEVLPPECRECLERFDAFLDWQAARHPRLRGAGAHGSRRCSPGIRAGRR